MSTRTELESEIYELMDDMDPSGKNTSRMKKLFQKMSDHEFYRYMDEFFDNPDKMFTVAYEAFDNPVTIPFIERVAKKQKVPMYEIVYKPYLTGDTENPPATVYPELVVDVPIKRLKQMVMSKSHTSFTNAKRDARTGQVTGEDKTARVTDVEAFSLIVQELYASAEEFYGPMSDDSAAMYEMLRLIQRDGEVSMKDLPHDNLNRMTLNTIQYMMLGSCISTNLIDESGYLLPSTIEARENKTGTIQR